jgi:hypothetical protein
MLHPGEVSEFMAYNCANTTNLVDFYSLLEPATCPSSSPQYAVERTSFVEIVQIKSERRVPVFRCRGMETVMSQYCGLLSVLNLNLIYIPVTYCIPDFTAYLTETNLN